MRPSEIVREFLPDLPAADVNREVVRFLSGRNGMPSDRTSAATGMRSWLVRHPLYLERARCVVSRAWDRLVPCDLPEGSVEDFLTAAHHPVSDFDGAAWVARHPVAVARVACMAIGLAAAESVHLPEADAEEVARLALRPEGPPSVRTLRIALRDQISLRELPSGTHSMRSVAPPDDVGPWVAWRAAKCGTSIDELVGLCAELSSVAASAVRFTSEFRAELGRDPSAIEFGAACVTGSGLQGLFLAEESARPSVDAAVQRLTGRRSTMSERIAIVSAAVTRAGRVALTDDEHSVRAVAKIANDTVARDRDLHLARHLSDKYGVGVPAPILELAALKLYTEPSAASACSAAATEYVALASQVRAAFTKIGAAADVGDVYDHILDGGRLASDIRWLCDVAARESLGKSAGSPPGAPESRRIVRAMLRWLRNAGETEDAAIVRSFAAGFEAHRDSSPGVATL